MKYGPPVGRNAIGSLVEVLEQEVYDTMLVREFIWGKKSPFIKLGRDIYKNEPKKRYPYEKFGMFVGVSSRQGFS